MAFTEWTHITPSTSAIPPFAVFNQPIDKSEQDDRDYRLIQLDNGLQAMLVHDTKADKAAASLDVAVGHLYDPDDMPGLAHFCEHLLFMGTELFPRENEYSEFLAKNNGASNAYTSTSNTNYYFNVATTALPQALTRFAAFFHCPLFSPSCTSRELNAVDSEHKKNHQSDMWRIFQLNKHLSRSGHVWSKFGSGNRESLSRAGRELRAKSKLTSCSGSRTSSVAPSPISSRMPSPTPSVASSGSEGDADGGSVGRETRRRLVEWWTKEYCAGRMRLCVTSNQSLDELAELVSTLFSPIPNLGCDPLPIIIEHPFGPDEMGTLVSVQTVMSFHAIEISFPLDYQPPYWRHKPAHLLSHFVGHEGPGSLHSYLKNKGWITSLSSGSQNLARGFAMFKVTVHLTEDGFRNHRAVTLAAFKYLSLLRSSEIHSWYQREYSTLSRIKFRFAEKRRPDDYAVWVSEHMAWPVPRHLILSAPQVAWEWNEGTPNDGEKKVREILEGFRPERGRVVLMAKEAEHAKLLSGEVIWEKEPWYGTGYRVERLDTELIQEAQGLNDIPELFLPGPNEFLPTNLNVDKRETTEPLKRPHLIRQTPLSTLWHKKDDKFWIPKAHVIIDLRSPVANSSPRAAVMTKLYADIVNDSLTEYSYDADLAGLSYNFVSHTTGLYVTMHGYNDKMSVLVHHVLEKIRAITINPERLTVMKELAKRQWDNFFLNQSYMLSEFYATYLMTKRQWTYQEKLAELPSITADEVQNHIKKLLSDANISVLVTGNMYKDEAINMAEMAENGLSATSLPLSELKEQSLILPPGSDFIWASPIPNPNQANSALSYYLNFGSTTDQRLRVTSALLSQILSEPAFNVLRTKEQLGYIVSCSSWTLPGHTQNGLRILVQSTKSPGFLEERVEAFLDGMKSVIEEMNEEDFAERKAGLEKSWLEKDKNLADETSKYLKHIGTGHFDFLRNESDAKLLADISKQDVLSLFMSHVHPSSPVRAKLSVHMRSQKPRPKRVSPAVTQAFENSVRTALPNFDFSAWVDGLRDGDEPPTLAEYAQSWKNAFIEAQSLSNVTTEVTSPSKMEALFAELPRLVNEHPLEGEGEDKPKEGAVYIDDIGMFKSSLEVAKDPGPMVEWNDLPISRF